MGRDMQIPRLLHGDSHEQLVAHFGGQEEEKRLSLFLLLLLAAAAVRHVLGPEGP